MRLIHFTASKVWRGHEQMIIDIYESLRDNGFVEKQLIVCPKDSKIFEIATQINLEVIGFDFKSEYDHRLAKKFKNIASEFNADMILLHNSKSHTIAVLSAMFFGLKVPMILFRTLIVNIGTNALRKFKYNYKGIKKIICVSEPVLNMLTLSVKDKNRLTIVGSVVDTDKFCHSAKTGYLHEQFNIPKEYKIVGNISAFSEVKDHYTWVDTVQVLFKRGIKAKYILIGEGSMESDIKAYVKLKGLENEIIFAGFRNDINKCLPEFDLFLFTSTNEATGGVILESYACNVPVVASRAGGIPTILIDNEMGLLADVKNSLDFANKSEILLIDEILRSKCTKAGYEFLMENSTRKVIGNKIFDVINEVLLHQKNKN